jgi:hypothetical protein
MTLGSVGGRQKKKLNNFRNVYNVKVCFFRYFIAFQAKRSYQNISRPNTGQMNTAHIPYILCTVFKEWKKYEVVEYNFIKLISHLALTKLSIAIHRTVPTKFSPMNDATYGELLQENILILTVPWNMGHFSKKILKTLGSTKQSGHEDGPIAMK